jgi:hypothetical protein
MFGRRAMKIIDDDLRLGKRHRPDGKIHNGKIHVPLRAQCRSA